MIAISDETDIEENQSGEATDTQFFNAYKQLCLDMLDHLPNTMLWVPINWLPHQSTPPNDEPSRFTDLINSLRQKKPGGIILGGPDFPERMTTGQLVYIAQKGTTGDLRGVVPYISKVEEDGVGGYPNHITISPPSALLADAVGNGNIVATNFNTGKPGQMHAWYVVWPFTNAYVTKWADLLAIIHGAGGVTNTGVPSEGTFITT